ncbi:phosphoribosyl transferase [Candidatus Wolfebacteria bacterium]|nr:phosphoribosyl transferase [Candidatus Wolfebacteria bacterium]
MFKDRSEAGQKLAKILEEFKNSNAIVLALPRGGIVIGEEIAEELNLPLDIIAVRKIGSQESEEYAIGAIDIDGEGAWNEDELKTTDKEWLKHKIDKEKIETKRRYETYRQNKPPLNISGKTAILVDDGIATGLTMKAAAKYAQKLNAGKIIIAAPLAPKETIEDLKKEADTRILETPPYFFSINQFYENFPQIEDKKVVEILNSQSRYFPAPSNYVQVHIDIDHLGL